MRLLMGIILGAALTIGGAYIYDSNSAGTASAETTGSATTTTARPMVNWDVVSVKWHALTRGAKHQWDRVTANVDADRATSN